MSIFNSIDSSLSEKEKIKSRQSIIKNFRDQSKNKIETSSLFFSPLLFDTTSVGQKNCENLVGQVSIPVGIAGPISAILKIRNQSEILKDLLIPLATTEGALVASINRGCKLLNESQPTVKISNVGMARAPVFECVNQKEVRALGTWIDLHSSDFKAIAESTSNHLTYLGYHIFQKENLLFVRLSFDTGEAMGMNMVTFATAEVTKFILSKNKNVTCPALSSNLCTDKKVSHINQKYGRGRQVTVTANLSAENITKILKTTSAKLLSTYYAKIIVGSQLAGLMGKNMHVANAAAAILTATGQDIAHTVDISQSTLTLKAIESGISAKLFLPTVPVGTIGGGTNLTTQKTASSLISSQILTSDILAATIGLAALAGELSGLAALSTNTLASSHKKLAR